MTIEEIFAAVEGEGVNAGLPTVYIRLPGARPTWCSAPAAALKPDGATTTGGLMAAIRRHWCGYIVVTGEEPLAEPDMEEFAGDLRALDQHIAIETSGAVYRKLACDLMSISPLLTSAAPVRRKKGAPPARQPYSLDALQQLVAEYSYQLKFTVGERAEIEEVRHVAVETGADPRRVVLIPSATKPKDLRAQLEWVLEASHAFGYRYLPRLTGTGLGAVK